MRNKEIRADRKRFGRKHYFRIAHSSQAHKVADAQAPAFLHSICLQGKGFQERLTEGKEAKGKAGRDEGTRPKCTLNK